MRLSLQASGALTQPSPENLQEHVKHAYELLCKANQRAIQVPAEVVGIITQARSTIKEGMLAAELETQFWNAYGLLSGWMVSQAECE